MSGLAVLAFARSTGVVCADVDVRDLLAGHLALGNIGLAANRQSNLPSPGVPVRFV